jgi:hypothetical protein
LLLELTPSDQRLTLCTVSPCAAVSIASEVSPLVFSEVVARMVSGCSSGNAEIPPADSPKLPLPASLQTAGVHSSPRPQNSSASPVRRLPSVKRTLEEDADAEGNSGPTKFARQCTAVVGPKLPSPLRTVVQVVPPVPPRKWDVALNVADAMVASLHTTTGTSSALAATPSSLASEILPELCCPLCAGIMIDPVVAQCSHGFWYGKPFEHS